MVTRLTPPAMVDEKLYRTFMVGLTHVVRLLPDLVNAGICSCRTSRTASGELQGSSLRKSGCDGRSFPVFFL